MMKATQEILVAYLQLVQLYIAEQFARAGNFRHLP